MFEVSENVSAYAFMHTAATCVHKCFTREGHSFVKSFVNARYCRVHKYVIRNVFTDFEHNYVEI